MAASLTFIPAIEQLSSRVIRILGCNPGNFTLQGTNTYLVGTGSKRLLIDTGEAKNAEYLKNLGDVLKRHNSTIDQVVLTHWHGDHIGGVSGVLDLVGHDGPVNVSKFKRISKPDAPIANGSVEVKFLEDETRFNIEGASLKAIYTPGHTDDHMSLWLEDESALFTGDCVLGEGSTVFEDLYTYMKSLDKLKSLNASVLYPGHGPAVTDPTAHIDRYIRNRNSREAKIICALSDMKPKSTEEIVGVVYEGLAEVLVPAATHNALLHLTKLQKEGTVEFVSDDNSRESWILKQEKSKF